VVVLLGTAAYFFIFKDSGEPTYQGEIPDLNTGDLAVTDDLQSLDLTDPGTVLDSGNEPAVDSEPLATSDPFEDQPVRQPSQDVASIPPTPTTTRDVSQVSSGFLMNSRASVQNVTNLMSTVPGNLNTTLLSSSGSKIRFEFVANSADEARDFVGRLQNYFGSSGFKVISENQVATNGRSVQKTLISANVTGRGGASSSETMEFLNQAQAQDWLKSTSRQYGLSLRQLTTQQGAFTDGYQKTPIFARFYGGQSAILSFLESFSTQNINFELAKVIIVSPDRVSYSDDNLVLVLNMFVYQL
jgi:hypothetical protein